MELTNPATERALLGCILFDNRLLDDCRITASLFSDPLNLEIWREIEKARARGSQADIKELYLRIPDQASYIATLTDNCVFNGVQYFKELKEFSRRRKQFDIAKTIANMVKDGRSSEEIQEYIEK